MGKQVRFFMSKKDENNFLEVVLKNESLILDKQAGSLTFEKAQSSEELSLFFSLPNANIKQDSNGYIDAIVAEVVQFSKSKEVEGGGLRNGRIWAEFKYYDNNRELITKNKQFSNMYKKLEKWIKNNFKLSKCNDYYIGSDAYEKYKEGKYVLMAGPRLVVEFE